MPSRRIAVAATGDQAREAALGVAADGGTAVDAAIAAAFVAMSTEPGLVSLSAGAFIAVWPADGPPVVVDGGVAMPGLTAAPDRFGGGVREVHTAYGGGVTMHVGHGSVGVPGAVPAMAAAHSSYGAVPWERLLAPAEAACRNGYPTSHAGARYLAIVAADLFGADPEALALVTSRPGVPLRAEEPATNPALADVLATLAREGPSLFTVGEVAHRMAADSATHGGLLGADDLAAYAPVTRTPVMRRLGNWSVALNPPPAVGGPVLAVMLGELSRRLGPGTAAEQWARHTIEVQRVVLGYRLATLDSAEDLEQAGHELLVQSGEGLAALRGPRSPETAHVSVTDDEGTACAITLSAGYGAGFCVPGTGLLQNNCLGEVELNRRGLHATRPGERLASNMAPTVARRENGTTLAIGSPGADRITTALVQVLTRVALGGESLQAAIDAPRLHVRFPRPGSPRVEHEPDAALSAAVASLGLDSHDYPGPHMYFGGVGAATTGPGGRLEAAGDGRREASTGVTPTA